MVEAALDCEVNTDLASETDMLGALTSHEVPPTNSMLRFRPRRNNAPTLMSTKVAETVAARFHSFGKSNRLSPR